MRMTSKLTDTLFVSLVFVLIGSGIVGCTTFVPTAMPTATATDMAIPTRISTPTTAPLLTLRSTPTYLERLDKRTQILFGDPASTVIDFFFEIQDCVRTDNKEKLASLILYPIDIDSINGEFVEIQNEEEFIANYEKIATPNWKDAILTQDPAKLFMSSFGVRINRGELWFAPQCIDYPDCKQKKYLIWSISNSTP
jgi:hypothetical protein